MSANTQRALYCVSGAGHDVRDNPESAPCTALGGAGHDVREHPERERAIERAPCTALVERGMMSANTQRERRLLRMNQSDLQGLLS